MFRTMEKILSDWLTDSLNVMICTENVNVSSEIIKGIGKYPTFKVHRVATERVLDLYFSQNVEWHCIIIDNDISFFKKVNQYLMNSNKWLPVIILGGNIPMDYGKQMHKEDISIYKHAYFNQVDRTCGLFVELCSKANINRLFSKILANSLKRVLFTKVPDKKINSIANSLFMINPITVVEWANDNEVSTRKMQRILKGFTDQTPKKLVSIYHAYRMAFANVDPVGNLDCEVFTAHQLNKSNKNRFLEYVLSRRSSLLKGIAA